MGMIYLDNASTTAVKKEVLDAMIPYLTDEYGNPSSTSSLGMSASRAIEKAREVIASTIKANPDEIFFTSGGTESNNWALKGYCDFIFSLWGNDYMPVIYVSPMEHPSIYNTCKYLEDSIYGAYIIEFLLDENKQIDVEKTFDMHSTFNIITPLISVMLGNNEIGTIQDIKSISDKFISKIVHTDAVQCYGQIPINVNDLGVDMLSASGHKLGAPKGIGFLYISKCVQDLIPSFIHGGHQQRGYRAGTENVPYIVGLAKAAEIANDNLNWKIWHTSNLKNRFIEGLKDLNCIVNTPNYSLPGIINVTFPKCEGEKIVFILDTYGICISAGSACSSNTEDKSRTLLQLGYPKDVAYASVRFSFGENNTSQDVDDVLRILHQVIPRMQNADREI